MAVVRSAWATSPIVIGGALANTEWMDAGKMAIPAGILMVKNDDKFLYVALDLKSDKGNDPGTNDYFWFTVDVDGNRQITPNRDVNYGLFPGQPNKIGRQYYLGPGRWTGLLNEESESRVHIGFNSSPNSAVPHRIWEMRLDLKELGVDMSNYLNPPVIRFGLRVKSSNPAFTYNFPANFYTNFANLHQIILSCQAQVQYPAGLAGIVIGGVGLIPASVITNGYATTEAPYSPLVKDVAFGGRMNLIGNRTTLQALWNNGARFYKIHHKEPTSGSFIPIRQNWANYRWNGLKYVLEQFGPDANDKYPMQNPATDYSIDDLLLQWLSYGYPAGLHSFRAEFFNATGGIVAAPAQTLTIMVDNNLPEVKIIDILHNGTSIPPCSIVNLTAGDGVKVNIKVYDPEGHLQNFALRAFYGANSISTIYSDSYSSHITPSKKWEGVTSLTVPSASEWVPPVTCAYQFRLHAYPRIHNGYSFIGYAEDTRHVTLVKPGSGVAIAPAFISEYGLGFVADDKVDEEGVEPDTLG